jgi:DNA invertase Pin-like site-specific DNA recombinase
MVSEAHQKVMASHLKRDAYLYIRQSTVRQVFANTESTKRQYQLRQKAVALGWPIERVRVIDSDLGKSGAERDRSGFQELVSQVSLGKAGIVMGLEVSRLARNSMDWHRLLEICALADTLILDEDGIYDPAHFNDRLLLGLKGTMSEAELHVLRARLQGGILNQARRGELRMRLPIGLVYDARGQVILDPDRQIQAAVRLLFETFEKTGSACATVKQFRAQGLTCPRRPHTGPSKGELLWGEPTHSQVLRVLHNPRYAGFFVFGQSRTRRGLDGQAITQRVKRDQWQIVLPDAHAGYISRDQFEANQRRLLENAQARGLERRKSPPREGPALLQGLVVCGRCGERMTVRYCSLEHQLAPHYMCQKHGIEHAKPVCQNIPGASIDQAVSDLLLETMTPINLEVSLAVEQELKIRIQEAEDLRRQQVERARYEAELSRRRFLRVDPDNRLVADSLEAEWNDKLRVLQQAQEEFERQCKTDQRLLDEQHQCDIRALANDFPRLWNDSKTPRRERKRLMRLLIEDVTLLKQDQLHVQIRFKGGAAETITLPLPKTSWQLRETDRAVIAEIDHLLDHNTDRKIADILNQKGFRSGWGYAFHTRMVARLRKQYALKSRYDRLREAGFLTAKEMAERLAVDVTTVGAWRRKGLLSAHPYTDKSDYLYEPPDDNVPVKHQRKPSVTIG